VTGKKRPSAQLDWFKRCLGFKPPQRADGRIILSWATFEALQAKLSGVAQMSALASLPPAFRAFDIEQVNTAAVMDFLEDHWANWATMKRAMKAWLSPFFAWANRRGHMTVNPCRELVVEKPRGRGVYIPHDHFLRIRAALASYTYEKTLPGGDVNLVVDKGQAGPEMEVFVDLRYLTCQCSTDIRRLRWSQMDERAGVIRFKPVDFDDVSSDRGAQ